jgi:hypothetical protein
MRRRTWSETLSRSRPTINSETRLKAAEKLEEKRENCHGKQRKHFADRPRNNDHSPDPAGLYESGEADVDAQRP